MPSYKKHILFSIIMVLPFFPEVYYLALAVIGASVVDLDTSFRYRNLLIMALSGGVLAFLLELFNITPFPGILLISIALFFFVAQHRGLVHSIPGVCLVAFSLSLFVLSFQGLLSAFNMDYRISIYLTSIIIGVLVLNRGFLILYALLVSLGIFLTPERSFNFLYIYTALFVGSLSHLILDLFTGNGVKLFGPISSHNYGKIAGLFLLVLWAIFVLIFNFFPETNFNLPLDDLFNYNPFNFK
ncbi:MAG: metal-dependent hydrolase [Methanobacteriaceae archaeon]|nr:metal-dependent hydrolase [Methanobacteriaceae archaeon]